MTDEIIYGLMEVFKRANNQYLKLSEITRRMQAQGFYQNVEFAEAAADIYLHYLNPPLFHEIENYRSADWGRKWSVAHWLPSKENNLQNSAASLLQTENEIQRAILPSETETKNRTTLFYEQDKENNPYDSTASLLQVGKEIQRTLSESEIREGTISLYGQDFYSFFASMDKHQRSQMGVDIVYYASEKSTCTIQPDDQNHWALKGEWLKDWYKENRIEPTHKIWLFIENITPLEIRIYTEWERNPDAYRRYKLLQESNPSPSVNLPIWYLVGEFLDTKGEIAHRLDIGKAITEKRPEISEQSVYACLSAYPYLFVRVGEGKWGLKEWNLEEVTRTARPVGSSLEENPNLPTEIVHLDEILADIASENLVYRILEESPNPLSVGEITERISKILGVNKEALKKATFFDPSDPRFHRQEDGKFTLDRKIKNLEEVIHKLSENERALKTSKNNEIQKLQETMESLVSQHKKEEKQLKEEQDILRKLAEELIEQVEHYEKINDQRGKRIQILSEFLTEAVPNIGQDKLKEIFERLHHKSQTRNTMDANEIIKFSNIIRKFLPRLKD
jgi:hypothetical protein